MKAIAIDPGESTGICIKIDDKYMTCTLKDADITDDKLHEMICAVDIVAYEDFMGYASHQMKVSSAGFYTVRLIGRIIEIATRNHKQLERRLPQNRRAFLGKAKDLLKSGQVSCIRPTRHECDALAHMLSYEYNQREKDAALQKVRAQQANS